MVIFGSFAVSVFRAKMLNEEWKHHIVRREFMTNRERMINLLLDGLDKELERFVSDDGGASEEAMIYYNINCPYFDSDSRCHCSHTISPTREVCSACKTEWLDSEEDV